MAKELTRAQLEYLEWLCLPEPLRFPETKKAYAEEHGVTTQTLINWEKNPLFRDEWDFRIKDMAVSPERTQMLLDSLYKRGINGDTKSAELYLKATNQMPNPKQEINIKTEKVSEITDAELEALIAEYAQQESQKRKEKPEEKEKA